MRLFLTLLISMMFMRVVDDGAGGDEDIGDFEITDEEIEADVKKDDISDNDAEPPKNENELLDRIAELESKQADAEQLQTTQSAIASIQQEYSDFDPEKVVKYLQGIDDESKREELNTPLGWKLIHLENFAKKDLYEERFDPGRGGGENFSFDDSFKKLEGDGGRRAVADMLRNSK